MQRLGRLGRLTRAPVRDRRRVVGGVPDTEAPTAPANLAASSVTAETLTLTWDASTDNVGVVSYEVQQRLASAGNETYATIGTPTNTTLAVTGLTEITAYRFRVRALDVAGNLSAWSPSDTGLAVTTADETAPTVPANLAASDITETTLTLDWDASTDAVGVVSYEVEQALDGGGFTWLATVAAPTVTLDVTGLTAGTAYRFRVRALDAAGNTSGWGPDDMGLLATTAAAFTFVAPSFNDEVYACVPDGTSFVFVGRFTQVTGVNGAFTRNRACRVDAAGNVEAWNPNASSGIYHACIDGTWVYLAGTHTTMGGTPCSRLCRVGRSTGVVDTWNPVASTSVTGVYTDARGVWAVATAEITYNGVRRYGIACLDKTTALLTSWDHGRDLVVTRAYAAYFDADTAYIVGNFTSDFNGAIRKHAVRLDLDTGLPTAWDPQAGALLGGSISVAGGYAYVGIGDNYVTWNGVSFASSCARVDAVTGALDSGWAPGCLPSCFAATPVGDDIILSLTRLTTDSSTNVGGGTRYGLARVAQSSASLNAWAPDPRQTPEVNFAMEYVSKNAITRGAMSAPVLVAGGTKLIVFGKFTDVTSEFDTKGTNCAVVNL